MSDQNDHSADSAIEAESEQKSLAALLTDGRIRWNGRFRAGRPIFVPTESWRKLGLGALTAGADPAQAPSTGDGHDDWDGEVDALELITPELAADHDACDRTFASKHEAFETGLLLGARGLSAHRRLPAGGARALPTRERS
jgi:hypothetical protein